MDRERRSTHSLIVGSYLMPWWYWLWLWVFTTRRTDDGDGVVVCYKRVFGKTYIIDVYDVRRSDEPWTRGGRT